MFEWERVWLPPRWRTIANEVNHQPCPLCNKHLPLQSSVVGMQFAGLRPAAGRPARPLAAPPSASRNSITPFNATQPAAAGQVGDKLLPLIRTPFDLVALPARVALGTLQSLPEILEKL